ncbi:MAG: hypothetical protein JXD18_03020 [Anaerolineae bacterium]|nr:hypothetical protein [Anaerolineae bacterium]
MPIRRLVRESAFRLARHDLAMFLRDHEADLMYIFRQEMQQLDDDLPEERLFIDLKLVPLGEMILKAALRAITRFLTEDVSLPQEEEGDQKVL